MFTCASTKVSGRAHAMPAAPSGEAVVATKAETSLDPILGSAFEENEVGRHSSDGSSFASLYDDAPTDLDKLAAGCRRTSDFQQAIRPMDRCCSVLQHGCLCLRRKEDALCCGVI